ncbi:AAA family ATPase [Candidatus Pacearchaeota archaeon]|nr:AAA family ATPase [Candidatus Pacearchaeota archaeon]
MNNYAVDFQDKRAVVVNLEDGQAQAVVNYPELKEEIALPVRYIVTSLDDRLLGTISSYLPERNRVMMRNGDQNSILIIGGNEELILKTGSRRYDIGRLSLEDLASQEAEQLKQAGFSHGYKLRSSEETGRLHYFEQDGLSRAVLALDISDYTSFLPIVIYDRIKQDIEGRTVKKQVPVKKPQKVHREVVEGNFVKFVKEHFQPRVIEGAFPYQDQEGEKERFFEYLDHGIRPVILNGPTGNGKTVLSRNYACERGLPFYFDTGSTSFRLSTAIGKFVPSPGNPTFSPGSLTLAAIHGGVYVLEEMPPIPQDELTGLNIFLETGELPLITQFGHEVVIANPNFRFVAAGNFHSNYTTNELNDALLQRFSQLKIGYPSRDNMIDILQARAPGLDYETAELITDAVEEMRPEARKFSRDLGLKGAVELAQRIIMGTTIPMRELFEDNIVNPLTTYENNIERRDGKLYTKLMDIVNKYV